jgi:hypothetical protein
MDPGSGAPQRERAAEMVFRAFAAVGWSMKAMAHPTTIAAPIRKRASPSNSSASSTKSPPSCAGLGYEGEGQDKADGTKQQLEVAVVEAAFLGFADGPEER